MIFDTTSSTRKAKNLCRDPRCTVVIGWKNETIVQLEGEGRRLEGAELEAAKLDYFRVWPDCRAHEAWPDVAYCSIRPHWLRYSCYFRGPTIVAFNRQQLSDGFRHFGSELDSPADV